MRIYISDDEDWIHEYLEALLKDWMRGVTLNHFLRHDECYQRILEELPDILVMDIIRDNIPGRPPMGDIDGFKLLSLLAVAKMKFPILVASGSFAMPKFESTAKKFAGPDLKVFYITKPITKELFFCALDRCAEFLPGKK